MNVESQSSAQQVELWIYSHPPRSPMYNGKKRVANILITDSLRWGRGDQQSYCRTNTLT